MTTLVKSNVLLGEEEEEEDMRGESRRGGGGVGGMSWEDEGRGRGRGGLEKVMVDMIKMHYTYVWNDVMKPIIRHN